jgi:hypothetical protein
MDVQEILAADRNAAREKEIGSDILLKIGREFGRSIEWLLTGEKTLVRGRLSSANLARVAIC